MSFGMKFFLAKVVLHRPTGQPHNLNNLNEDANQSVLAKIIEGEYAALPDGTIVEPVAEMKSEADAHGERELRMADPTNEIDYRVIGVL